MLQKIKQWIQLHHLIEKKDRIVIGVSGGADSVCLFYVLNSLKEEMDLNLCVVHINHGIRGEEALRDQEFVKALAAFNDIPYIEQTILVEQLAREHGWTPEEGTENLFLPIPSLFNI